MRGIFASRSTCSAPRHIADVEIDDAGLEQTRLGQRVLDGGVLRQLAVGKAGRVTQEILHGHGRCGGDVTAAGRHLHVLECRKPLGDWIHELQGAVLDQDHGGHRHHGLGHRVDAEDGVGPHGIGAPWIAHAQRGRVDQLALARDHHDRARQFLVVDLLLEDGREARQSRRRHADAFRRGAGDGRRGGRGGRGTLRLGHGRR